MLAHVYAYKRMVKHEKSNECLEIRLKFTLTLSFLNKKSFSLRHDDRKCILCKAVFYENGTRLSVKVKMYFLQNVFFFMVLKKALCCCCFSVFQCHSSACVGHKLCGFQRMSVSQYIRR